VLYEDSVVVIVKDGAAALQELAVGSFDLLITDLAMPLMTGIEVADAARRDHAELPVIIMTGRVSVEDEEAIAAMGAHLLRKPFGIDALSGLTEQALRSRG
jgi:two-component system capsular synthesis sensor histidine kinase RcsC